MTSQAPQSAAVHAGWAYAMGVSWLPADALCYPPIPKSPSHSMRVRMSSLGAKRAACDGEPRRVTLTCAGIALVGNPPPSPLCAAVP